MKKLFIILLLFSTNIAYAKHLHPEREYQTYWCNKHNGQMEYVLPDKARVDCLLPDMAVEVDFAPKWAECIGQALYYSKKTNTAPACLLIMENKEKDYKYLLRLKSSVDKDFIIYTIDPTIF